MLARYTGRLKVSAAAVVSVTVAALVPTKNVFADKCGKAETYFNWNCSGDEEVAIISLLVTIVNWLAVGVAIAVVGGIIYGAILYTTSGGNPEQSKKGMDTIRNAIIALVLYFGMWAIMNFLVPGGLFNTP